ncbi:hypothetical protein GCM10011387_16030 [Pedobacter quisquiliarum]|uniref:Uncharacterized protein n=1 Tax=Pedobacter quisquiliarum TaxID=1834438 RepID=A0A916U828_9SPHI|nr:hypothetical protein [Pedobacter quisquiliarum]GGC63211.1 hypothetical protein GCM10011387_16030 [Pedobacter quisquiliarum]
MAKKMRLFSVLFFILSCSSLIKAQEALKFKLYDKEITFDESYLDKRFAPHVNNNKVLSKYGETSYKEYTFFKNQIKKGNAAGQYLVVDNLRRFHLYPFENNYYFTLKSDTYKLYIKWVDDKPDFKRKMEIRNELLGWIIDIILEYQ